MGILDGGLARLFSSAFSALYLDGELLEGTGRPVYDGARITGYLGDGDTAIKVQTDRTSDRVKQLEHYAPGDVALIILTHMPAVGDLPAYDVEITNDSKVKDGYGDTYRIIDTEQDPARSHWYCHARPV